MTDMSKVYDWQDPLLVHWYRQDQASTPLRCSHCEKPLRMADVADASNCPDIPAVGVAKGDFVALFCEDCLGWA